MFLIFLFWVDVCVFLGVGGGHSDTLTDRIGVCQLFYEIFLVGLSRSFFGLI